MGRLKGVPNKLTIEVKERLQGIMDNVVSTLDIDNLDTNQKIKLLQIGLQYLLPKLQSHRVQDVNEDLPLWLEDARTRRKINAHWIKTFLCYWTRDLVKSRYCINYFTLSFVTPLET